MLGDRGKRIEQTDLQQAQIPGEFARNPNRAKAEAIFKNQGDEIVFEAYLTGVIPNLSERRMMQAMMVGGDATSKLH